MSFLYYKLDGSLTELTTVVGKKIDKQFTNNKLLNSLFTMVDNGDNILQEEECSVFSRLLSMADNLIKESSKNGILDSKELAELIKKIKNNNINLNSLKKESLTIINPQDYSLENLKKRYPSDKYQITEMTDSIKITEKKTKTAVLSVDGIKEGKNIKITTYKQGVPNVEKEYDKNGTILYEREYENKHMNGMDIICCSKKAKVPIANMLYKDISQKTKIGIHTTGDDFANHINLITEENVLQIMLYYQQKYGEDLLDAISSEYGMNFTSEKRQIKTNAIEHIKKCIQKAYGYKSNLKKISQINNKYHTGDKYSVEFTSDTLKVKNLKSGKIKTVDLKYFTKNFNYKQRMDIISYLQTLPGEALMDIAIECDKLSNGQNFWTKLSIDEETLKSAEGQYDPNDESVTLAILEQKAPVDVGYRITDALIHEIGHSVDNVASKEHYMTEISVEFNSVFTKELTEFKEKGYIPHGHGSRQSDVKYYYTANAQEMFADCYEYLMTGKVKDHDVQILEEHFSGCITATAKLLEKIRNMKDSERR